MANITPNSSQAAINKIPAAGYPTPPGYPWATLATCNATAPLGMSVSAINDQGSSNGGNFAPRSKITLAM